MPRVKIDYIVSFSSEDKEHPASNLLSWEINKKKWLCREWEPSCSVVLQLAKAIQIESVNIGVHHAALVEVLVGLSEKPNDPFEVLVPSCVFVSAADSRRGEGAERVRSFSGDQLSDKRARRWDRVRVVCSQPYNKRVKYGLTFVHIHSSESGSTVTAPEKALDPKTVNPDPSAKVPDLQAKVPDHPAASGPLSRLFGLDTYSSDDDDFRPGELFAQRNNNTDAQIRQASSQALNNISGASTKLVKTPIAKPARPAPRDQQQTDRRRDSLLYTADDGRPHHRIDGLVQHHRAEQERARKRSPDRAMKDSGRTKRERIEDDRDRDNNQARKEKGSREKDRTSNVEVQRKENERRSDSSSGKNDGKRNDNGPGGHAASPAADKPLTTHAGGGAAAVLAGVVFSISGYQNPRRACVRDAALRLGARYEPHALQRCTHLVCAFPNTPKLRELQRASPGAHAVRAEWIEHAAVAGRRPPEAPYAPHKAPPPAPSPPAATSPAPVTSLQSNSDADTDDEIERAMRAGAGEGEAAGGGDDDGADTDRDEPPPTCEDPQHLPALFAGSQFVVDAALPARTAALLRRYLRAYGALVLQPDEVLDDSSVDYVVTGGEGWSGAPAACRVSPRWVWRCHRKRKVCAVRD